MRKEKVIEFSNMMSYASKLLPEDVYHHSLRVVFYVMCNNAIPEDIHDDCIVAAMGHDLIEDGGIDAEKIAFISHRVANALDLLTKREDESYVEYINNIKAHSQTPDGRIAYWVKMADMKDHLAQKKTLTDRLKEKYLEALPLLLP